MESQGSRTTTANLIKVEGFSLKKASDPISEAHETETPVHMRDRSLDSCSGYGWKNHVKVATTDAGGTWVENGNSFKSIPQARESKQPHYRAQQSHISILTNSLQPVKEQIKR